MLILGQHIIELAVTSFASLFHLGSHRRKVWAGTTAVAPLWLEHLALLRGEVLGDLGDLVLLFLLQRQRLGDIGIRIGLVAQRLNTNLVQSLELLGRQRVLQFGRELCEDRVALLGHLVHRLLAIFFGHLAEAGETTASAHRLLNGIPVRAVNFLDGILDDIAERQFFLHRFVGRERDQAGRTASSSEAATTRSTTTAPTLCTTGSLSVSRTHQRTGHQPRYQTPTEPSQLHRQSFQKIARYNRCRAYIRG